MGYTVHLLLLASKYLEVSVVLFTFLCFCGRKTKFVGCTHANHTCVVFKTHSCSCSCSREQIPLRYQLLFMASRSFIRDPVVGNGTTLPLFRRGTERERFDRY